MAVVDCAVQVFETAEPWSFRAVKLSDLAFPIDGRITWIDMLAPSRDEIVAIGTLLNFHPLAIEDAIKLRQRPKLDVYQQHLFMVLYELDFLTPQQELESRELAVFISDSVVVTVHTNEIAALHVARNRWAERCREGQTLSAGMLIYTIADAIVDGYFPCMDKIAEDIDDLEGSIFSGDAQDVLQDVFALKRSLLDMRRLIAPTREVFNSFTRREVAVLGEGSLIYFQDIYDHIIRVTDAIDADRDVLSTVVDVHLSLQSNRMNQTVRTLTAASIVLMSMTLIAGIYGMNFVNMPELEWRYGYYITLGAIAIIGLVVAWVFRRLRWW